MKTHGFQRTLLITVMSALLAAVAFCGLKVHVLGTQQATIKRDYSVANNISFGLLSVNKWRDLVVASVSRQIHNFNLTPGQRDSLQKEVEQLLYGLVDKADSLINAPKKSLGGKIKQLAIRSFVHEDELHKLVPAFAHKITTELMSRPSRHKLEYLAKSKLEDLGQSTYDSSKTATLTTQDSIFKKYNVTTEDGFDKVTHDALARIRPESYGYTYALIGAVILVLGVWYLLRTQSHLYIPFYVMSILIALVLLAVGLTTTMIEIDARINSLDFQLIGESIVFKNQVIFFQSKSIFDVVRLLIHTGKLDSIFVGILILCFSIFFPIAKLSSTGVYLLSEKKWGKSKLVKYFAFYSGKWSMADVTVVAIFMAYIGFNGILDSQMQDLDVHSGGFTSIATNQTSLEPGYIIFVAFVLFGLALSQILKIITAKKPAPAHQS